MLLRPPLATLFPYTTLFRSIGGVLHGGDQPDLVADGDQGAWRDRPRVALDQLCVHCVPSPRGDRKSTRLNSSHVAISYAVFCLKKKKHTIPRKLNIVIIQQI